ncbi:MAG: YdcF family protein, partial [Kiritimatiellae bacterium]|nr:YdcF family protein [Kiritimatiellia bacterium]
RNGMMHGAMEGLPDADVIIVLGGGVGAHEKCHAPELFPGADRVWQSARLYNAKKSRVPGLKVYCTGGGCEYAAIPLLTELGVSRDAIWFSEKPRNTEEEARLIKSQFACEKPKVFLVTSAWHMSRAKMLFDRVGFEVIPAPTDFEMNCVAEKPIEFADFVPAADALYRNSCAIKEWVARFGYWSFRR